MLLTPTHAGMREKWYDMICNVYKERRLWGFVVTQYPGIHWPMKITNIELYTKIQTEEWSTTIRRRRLNWLGHLMRLHPEIPARLALAEYLRKVKRPKGRPQRTWMELTKHDLKAIVILDYNKPNKTIEKLTQMAHDRNYWRNFVRP